MQPRPASQIFIYTALPCEAKPLVAHFKLKKETAIPAFAVYSKADICLTVTGPGKNAMAAGIAYTQALFASARQPVLLNIGIAGHKDHTLGALFLIDKIIDRDSGKKHYPPLLFNPPCATDSLQTVSKPLLDYNQPHLYDMEASAFYETAGRFSTGELIQCLKVISDNRTYPATDLQPKQVAEFIAAQISGIEGVMTDLFALAALVTEPEIKHFKRLTESYRFSANEQLQLKNQLSRWDVLTNGQALEIEGATFTNGKDVLRWLELEIKKTDFRL
jgi:adenosylhomocysteine nucleosidase